LAVVTDRDSLCVLDLYQPSLPFADDPDIQDMHVYLRIGLSDTWIHHCLESPEAESGDNDDESVGPFQDMAPLDSRKLNELAMQVARGAGFGSLRNRRERQDFAIELFRESPDLELNDYNLWEIAKTAESLFTLGVAPALAKSLEKEGKSKSEIARALGLSKERVERALGTTTPAHIAKLL
jgi:hypothetical protein